MKVVLLTQAFPPHPEVGSLRAKNLVEAMLHAGHQVTVVTQRVAGGEYPDAGQGPLRVIPVDLGTPYARRVRHLLHWRPWRDTGGSGGVTEPTLPETSERGVIREAGLALFSTPDGDLHLAPPFIRAGVEAVRDHADLLYTSAPPFSTHLAGLVVKWRTGIPWVAEFRDPWRHPWTERIAPRHVLSNGLDYLLERAVIRSADAKVLVTRSARDLLERRGGRREAEHLHVAMNGIPDLGSAAPEPRSGPFTILHAGSLYMDRNPIAFLEGIQRFVAARGLRPSDLQVRLIGRSREYNGVSVAGMADRLGLGGFVSIADWLPHQEVLREMRAASALLLFAQNQPLQIPNKLFEYLAVNTPILGFVDREGESARLLGRVDWAIRLYDDDPERAAAAIARLYGVRGEGLAVNPVRAAELRAELGTTAQLRGLVAELAARFTGRPGSGSASQAPRA